MSEQYAFAIGFDLESNQDEAKGQPDVQDIELLAAIDRAIHEAGLPDVQTDRWDEFGQGRLFWGTHAECEAVKQVLSAYPVFVQEERNLEPGFYADPQHTYYADEAGSLYRLHPPMDEAALTLEPTTTIPMDAYRLRSIDPSVEQAVQRCLSPAPDSISPTHEEGTLEPAPDVSIAELEAQIASLIATAETVASTKEAEVEALKAQIAHLTTELESAQAAAAQQAIEVAYRELQNQSELQASQIHELEQQITVFEDQMAALQTLSAAKVDPQLYADLQAQVAQQSQELEALKAQLQTLTQTSIALTEYEQLQQQLAAQNSKNQELQQLVRQLEQQLQETATLAAQKVDPAKYQALEQTAADQTALAEDLRRTIQQLERDLREWQTVAESKVDWSDYDALQQELRLLQTKPKKKGLFSRLFGWLFG